MKNIILFELNEVPWTIIRYFIRECPRSNLARFRHKFFKFETYTEDQGHLSPWITWPTLHRGVANDKHLIHNFGQRLAGIDSIYPPVWTVLSEHGIKTGVFGSFHSYPPSDKHCFHVPDPFAASPECFPRYLEPFQDFCLKMSRQSARNVSRSIPMKETLLFLATLPKIGIRPRTMASIFRQLASEQRDKSKTARRRTYQVVLAFDVFLKQLKRHKPQFCTFFTNHVASAMHRYWAAAFPEDYQKLDYEQGWMDTYKGEILFAMDKADKMIGELIRFVDDNEGYQLMIASSMGQKAVDHGVIETQLWISYPQKFFQALGLDVKWEPRPAMFAQYNFIMEGDPQTVEQAIKSVEINGEKLKYRADGNFFSLDFGHANLSDVCVKVGDRSMQASECGLENLHIEDKSTSSAYHIPEGSLLIYNGGEAIEQIGRVSTLEIAPYLLHNFSIPSRGYMKSGQLIKKELASV